MGRDYIMHHGVPRQQWHHRRWQNPDGSYTDAGFIHYYGHPRIRGQKKEDSEKAIQAKDVKDLFDKLDTIANNSKYSKHRGKFGRSEKLPNTIAETTPFDDYAFRMKDRFAEAKNAREFNNVLEKFKTLAEEAVNNAPDEKKADVAGELLEWKDYVDFELEDAPEESGDKKGVFSKLATQVGENMKKSMEFRKDPENQKKYGQGIIPGLINMYKDSKQKKAAEAEAKRQADEAAENARKAEQTAKDFINTYRDRDDATREDAYRAFLTAFNSDDNPVANALLTELHKTDKKSYKALTDENSAKKNELAKRRIDTSVEIFKDLGWYDDKMKRIQIEDPDEFEYQAAEVMWNSKEFALSKTGKQKVKELKRIYEEMGK